jgi:signal transduction histidine kinase
MQTRQIAELLDRLFDASRIRAGRLSLTTEQLDLVEVLRNAVDVAGSLPKAPLIKLLPTHGPIMVQGDSVRLEQVFVNLLANAVEHAPNSPTIDVNVRKTAATVTVEVCDLGPGITAEVLPLLFKPYALIGQKSSGLGLGLYLAREIVTAHGGTIEAESNPAEGTSIIVRLPLGKKKA